jgi:hypothetical protein
MLFWHLLQQVPPTARVHFLLSKFVRVSFHSGQSPTSPSPLPAMKMHHSALLLAALSLITPIFAADEPIDFNRARQIFQRQQRGENITAEDRTYLERAMAERRQQNGGGPGGAPRNAQRPAPFTEHLTPLTELGTGKYKDQDGGLYGGGRNEPPKDHLEAAMKEAAKIKPLDAEGRPAPDGKIGLISVGMSNTTQEFSAFVQKARGDAEKTSSVTLVDCAQGGQTGLRWADPKTSLWTEVDRRLAAAGVSPKQVQVAWMKEAEAGPANYGDFPKHAQLLRDDIEKALVLLRQRFPKLQLVYLSSRIYAGYASTPLNPEPYAYESAFAVRWVIQDQIAGKADLNYSPAKGEVKAPLVLWGPYLWADGKTARKADGLSYEPEDLGPDGTHPSNSGREKVAGLLLKFLKTDPTAKPWCVKGK